MTRDSIKGAICVTMIDKAMSGWGRAEGLKNKLVIVCEDRDQADRVEAYARSRDEMKRVSLQMVPDRIASRYRTQGAEFTTGNHMVQIKEASDMPAWIRG